MCWILHLGGDVDHEDPDGRTVRDHCIQDAQEECRIGMESLVSLEVGERSVERSRFAEDQNWPLLFPIQP
jgi:hypothetical protein